MTEIENKLEKSSSDWDGDMIYPKKYLSAQHKIIRPKSKEKTVWL